MSDYIARARVKVEPDLKGFAKAVRDGVAAATAKPVPIKVVPVTKGFTTAIRKAIGDKPIPVPIIPTRIKAFSKAIADAAVTAKVEAIPAVDIPVFRAALQTQVDAATAGVVAAVPVAPVGGIAQVAALETAIAGLSTEIQNLAIAQSKAGKAGKTRETGEKSLTKTEALRDKITKNLKASELALADAQNASLTAQERSTAATTAATKSKTAYGAAIDLVAAEETAANKNLLERARVMEKTIASEARVIESVRQRARDTKKLAPILEAKAQLEKEITRLLRLETAGILNANVAEEQRIALSKLASSAKSLETRATKAHADAIAGEIAALRVQAVEGASAFRTRVKEIKNEEKALEKLRAQQIAQGKTAAGQIKFARRGAAATALSLLGIRGATLASTGAFLAGAAAASIFALSVKSAADLQQELNVFRETAGATAEEMERVRVVSEELGRDIRLPGISAADAAKAMTGLARAGLSVQDSIAGATGVLQLAIAANIDMARSTEIVASALNAFGLSGSQAISVADTLASAANLAQGSIDDMGIAMQQAAAVGRQAGLSFEDTATFLTILAKAGLRGSDAGTSLRTGLIRLINPTEKAQKVLDQLNVSIRDVEGNIRPDVFQNLAIATADMTKKQRDQTIAQLAGNDAVRAFSIAMRVSLPQLLKYRASLRETGTAARLTAARAEGLVGSARGLASNFQTVGISIGRFATPALQNLVEGINSTLLAMSQSDAVAKTLTDTFTSLGSAFSIVTSTFQTALPILGATATALFAITQAIGIGPILAGIAAFKLFKPAVGALAVAFGLLQSRVLLATSTFGAFRNVGLGRTMAGVATFRNLIAQSVSSMNLWVVAITGAAIGLTYLASRESTAEKAAKALTSATTDLASAMERQATAAQSVSTAERGTTLARRALDTAKAAVAQARLTLSTSSAAEGSEEYRQNLNNLKIALQDVVFAQQDLDTAINNERAAREENLAAMRAENASRNEVAQALNDDVRLAERMVGLIKQRLAEQGKLTRATAAEAEARGRQRIIDMLDKEIDKRADSEDAAEREIAGRMITLQRLIQTMRKVPDTLTITTFLTTENVRKALLQLAPDMGIKGKKAGEAWVEGVLNGIFAEIPKLNAALSREFEGMQQMAAEASIPIGTRVGNSIADGLRAAKANIVAALNEVLSALQAEAERFAEQEDILTIMMGGRPTAQQRLALAQRQKENLESSLAAIMTKGKATGWTKELIAERRRLRDELASANEKVAGIEDEIKTDAEQAAAESEAKAEDIASALKERGQAILDRLARNAQKFLNRQERASLTEWVSDDIRANRALKRLYKRQIELIKERVKDKEIRNEAIRNLQAENFKLDLDLVQLLKQQAERRQERVRQALELDIQFFSTRENVRGEINARRRFIAYLKRLQAEEKKGTVAWKELRNEIAEQEAAIRDLRNQTKERNNAFRELTFEFMQAQQGFAANLLGNLIPIGASHNLVGVSTPGGGGGNLGTMGMPEIPGVEQARQGAAGPDRGLLQAQARAAGATQIPMGRDQGSVEIELLRTIAQILARMERGARHPEAQKSRVTQSASFETMPHGAAYAP